MLIEIQDAPQETVNKQTNHNQKKLTCSIFTSITGRTSFRKANLIAAAINKSWFLSWGETSFNKIQPQIPANLDNSRPSILANFQKTPNFDNCAHFQLNSARCFNLPSASMTLRISRLVKCVLAINQINCKRAIPTTNAPLLLNACWMSV